MFTKKPDSRAEGAPVQNPVPSPVSAPAALKPAGPAPLGGVPVAPAPRPTPSMSAQKSVPSIFAGDISITGNIQSQGEIQIDGKVEGDIKCTSLIIGEAANVSGGIVAEDVVVRGKVNGSIRGVRVTLEATSHVEGDVYHKTLAIQQGAYFEGKSRRSEDPIGTAPEPGKSGTTNGAAG